MEVELFLWVFVPREAAAVLDDPEEDDDGGGQEENDRREHHHDVLEPVPAPPALAVHAAPENVKIKLSPFFWVHVSGGDRESRVLNSQALGFKIPQ